ncbi:MAG: carbamoyltransferase [Verrucomicrobia bacterium]|nr:carbamoyltransferase [Verrucomicrobiota bacterium]
MDRPNRSAAAPAQTTILGISAFYHDSAACLVRDGAIVAAAQEERFSRRKHDASFPKQAIEACLRAGGVAPGDLHCVAFYEKPFVKFDRLLHSYLACAPAGLRSFLKAMPVWIREKIWIKDLIRKELHYPGPILFPEHHESHAASAFFPSPFPEAAFLTVDGVGEWTTTSFGVGRGNRVAIRGELRFPHSLGLLYSAFTYYTGFKVNSGEYKLMGLAPYGEPAYRELILRELVTLQPDGSFWLNPRYFGYVSGLRMINRRFERLFGGPPRAPESPLTRRDMDLARSIQEVAEEILSRMARHVRRQTGLPKLCLAGGVALNCVANGRLLREGQFDDLWIQPAAGDAGGALGAALLAWHHYLGQPRQADGVRDTQQGSYLGPAFDADDILQFLTRHHLAFTRLTDAEIPARVADLIAAEKVVGWFTHRMEFGPRALGARSILGDARSPRMQELMNLKIKFRESFRPFAPCVLLERAGEYFTLDRPSPYMLLVASVRDTQRRPLSAEERQRFGLDRLLTVRSTIPAVTHVDYSARVQTVAPDAHPLFHRLLQAFAQRHGCPVLINTSFNVRGEPIVCTPDDAYRCFMRTNMDYLLLGNFLLEKTAQQPLDKDLAWLRQFDLD